MTEFNYAFSFLLFLSGVAGILSWWVPFFSRYTSLALGLLLYLVIKRNLEFHLYALHSLDIEPSEKDTQSFEPGFVLLIAASGLLGFISLLVPQAAPWILVQVYFRVYALYMGLLFLIILLQLLKEAQRIKWLWLKVLVVLLIFFAPFVAIFIIPGKLAVFLFIAHFVYFMYKGVIWFFRSRTIKEHLHEFFLPGEFYESWVLSNLEKYGYGSEEDEDEDEDDYDEDDYDEDEEDDDDEDDDSHTSKQSYLRWVIPQENPKKHQDHDPGSSSILKDAMSEYKNLGSGLGQREEDSSNDESSQEFPYRTWGKNGVVFDNLNTIEQTYRSHMEDDDEDEEEEEGEDSFTDSIEDYSLLRRSQIPLNSHRQGYRTATKKKKKRKK